MGGRPAALPAILAFAIDLRVSTVVSHYAAADCYTRSGLRVAGQGILKAICERAYTGKDILF